MVHLDLIATPGDGFPAVSKVLLGCLEGEEPTVEGLPESLAAAAVALARRPGWRGKSRQSGETLVAETAVALHGLGKAGELDARQLAAWFRRLVENAGRNGQREIAVVLPAHPQTRGRAAAERTLRQILEAGYHFQHFHNPSGEDTLDVERIHVVPPPGEAEIYRVALGTAEAVAAGVNLARDLGNAPPNQASPEWLVEQCRTVAHQYGLAMEVLGLRELEERGMGGILAVGLGSRKPPRLVRLSWDGGGEGAPTVALVGKGVTFDSGGITLKAGPDMHEMKYDKAGACAVLGAIQAVAALGLPVRLRGYLALAENMPDGDAYRPGDIVRCYNGKTVEILNTDAEGRMMLADALGWAADERPDSLVEVSTLTGATAVALGLTAAALYTPDPTLSEELIQAAAAAGERLWPMPLFADDRKRIKGSHSDLKNVGPRWGSGNIAAVFLGEFTGEVRRWAHIDIAGPAYIRAEGKRHHGATGFGVPFLVSWIANHMAGRVSP